MPTYLGDPMRSVTVNKAELVATLKENMAAHEADFALAWDGFIKKANKEGVKLLQDIDAAKPGDRLRLSIHLEQPQNHADDYARVIAMCNWDTRDEVTLEQSEFRQYVQDEWGWSENFTASNMLLTGSARPSRK